MERVALIGDPQRQTIVWGATIVQSLAKSYRKLLRLQYRPGDDPPANGAPDNGWQAPTDPDGARKPAFRALTVLPRVTWPDIMGDTQPLHLIVTASDRDARESQRGRALELGAEQLLDRTHAPEQPLHVFAGHLICVSVAWARQTGQPLSGASDDGGGGLRRPGVAPWPTRDLRRTAGDGT